MLGVDSRVDDVDACPFSGTVVVHVGCASLLLVGDATESPRRIFLRRIRANREQRLFLDIFDLFIPSGSGPSNMANVHSRQGCF